tara:strand:+ start:244 stop:774 length:531 start_codon:yes stop_codon:yes gene_type:complete
MDLSFKTGLLIGQDQDKGVTTYVIKYTEKTHIEALKRASEWFVILNQTCITFQDGWFKDGVIPSFFDIKGWLNFTAMSTRESNPVILVGEQIAKTIEQILADLIGPEYIYCIDHFYVYEGDNTLLIDLSNWRLLKTFSNKFTEEQIEAITQDLQETPEIRQSYLSAKTLTLKKASR